MDRKQLADAIDAVQSHSELGNLVSRVLWPFLDELTAHIAHLHVIISDREAELLRIRTTAHAAAHALDNIATEAGLQDRSVLGVQQYVRDLRAQLAAEQAARVEAERERCPECNGPLSECGEMTEDGPSLDCRVCRLGSMVVEERKRAEAAEARAADAERRLGVAREALRSAEVMLRGARDRLAASGATMGVYDATLAEVQAALAAARPRT